MYIDFKSTIWERITIPEEYKEKVLEAIKDGSINECNDAYGLFGEIMDNNYELLLDTGTAMYPDENNGCSTIEVHEKGPGKFDDE